MKTLRKLGLPFLFAAISLIHTVALAESKSIKIGGILPLSGQFAAIGTELRRGMELAASECTDCNLKLIFEDDQELNRVAAVKGVNKLVSIDKVDLVLIDVVNTEPALSPILNQRKVRGIVVWDSNKKINSLGEYIFGMGYGNEIAGEDMADFAFNTLKNKTTAIVSAHDEWSELISKAYKERFIQLGGKVVYSAETEVGETDFLTIASKIKKSGAESVYFPIFSNSLTAFVKQTKNLGYTGAFLSGDGLTQADLDLLAPLIEGSYATQVYLEDKELLQKYKAKYGSDAPPYSLGFAALGYDSIKLIIAIAEDLSSKGVELTTESIKESLNSGFEHRGYTGLTKFNKERTTDKRQAIYIVKDGEFVPLK